MRKIKVLHLELSDNLGGIESFLYNVYSVIDKSKVQFDFVTRSYKPAKGDELAELGAGIINISNYSHPFRYMKELRNIVSEGEYDVVHIHKNSAAIILPFYLLRNDKNVKVFVHSHNTRPSIKGVSSVLHRINKDYLYKHSSEHLACSQVAGEWLYGKKRDFAVIKNGIITNKFLFDKGNSEIIRKELNIPDDAFVIGNVGRFSQQKNQKRLIDIFIEIQKSNSNTYLILIGDGELRFEVEAYACENNIPNIMFLGVRKDISMLMMAMDSFVMTSIYEGLPLVAVEAQAAGLDLYLANTISRETELTDSVEWFDLNESNCDIAKKIKLRKSSLTERLKRNQAVKNQGYDIEKSAAILLNKYEEVLDIANNART